MSNTFNSQSQTGQKYWVVGGKYETMEFNRLIQGTESVFGPFLTMQDAQNIWRSIAEETRCQATMRFTILSEP